MNKPKSTRRPASDAGLITMEELDAVLFPRLPVDVTKLPVWQAQMLLKQLKEILR